MVQYFTLHYFFFSSEHYFPFKYSPVVRVRMDGSNSFNISIRPKKKLFCCPLPTDRKMRKNRVGFFLYFFYTCQIWAKNLLKFVFNGLKKHLYIYICVLTAFRPSFPHLETFKKILENSTLTVR